MRHPVSSPRFPDRWRNPSLVPLRGNLAVVLLVAAVLSTVGCATTGVVRSIVENTNVLLLHPLEGGWQPEVARIDTTIDANPEDLVLVHTLRLRQAMVLTVHKQDNLALATFDLIDTTKLVTEHQKFFDTHEHLVWWFKVDGRPLGSADVADAEAALDGIKEANDGLSETSEVRQYLAEMRSWIALAYASAVGNKDKARELLEDGLNRFAQVVPDGDVARIKARLADSDAETISKDETAQGPRALRLRLRAPLVVEQYRAVAGRKQVEPVWTSKTQALLEAVPKSD